MANISWSSDADGNWSQSSNWSGGVLPGSSDNVTIDTVALHTITHDTGNDKIASLDVGNDGVVVTGGTLSVLAGAVFNASLSLENGYLSAGDVSLVDGSFDQASGTLAVSTGATLTLAGKAEFVYGTGDIDGPGTLSTTGTTSVDEVVYIGGGLHWDNSSTIALSNDIITGDASGDSATLTNLAGASIDFVGDGLNIYNSSNPYSGAQIGTLTLINQGLIAKTGGSGTSYISAAVTNTAIGTIQSDSGFLNLDGGGSFGGVIDGSGIVDFDGGTSTVGSTLVVTNVFDQAGGIVAVSTGATLTLAGKAEFVYGTGDIDGPGTLSTTGTTSVDEVVYIGGGLHWDNSSTIALSNDIITGDASGDSATLTNLAGASIDFVGDGLNIYNSSNPYSGAQIGTLTLINQGLIAKTGGSGTSYISAAVTNTAIGTIQSDSGFLNLDGGGSFGGVIDGSGIVDFDGGTSTVGSTLVVTNVFDQAGGIVAVSTGATLTLAGKAEFVYGTGDIDGPGTLSTTGTTSVDEVVYIGGGLHWDNSSTIALSNDIITGDASGDSATLTNLAGASIDFVGDGLNIYNSSNPYSGAQIGTLTLINQGLIAKTGGSGTSYISAAVTNTAIGTIQSDSGFLNLDGGGSFGGVIDGSGIVDFDGGTSTVGSTLVVTNVFDQAGGIVAVSTGATLTLAGKAEFVYGTGDIDGPGTLSTTGTTSVDEVVYIGGGLHWDNSSTIALSNDIITGDASGDSATLTNLAGASIDFVGDGLNIYNSSNPYSGAQIGTLTLINQGLIAKTGGSGTSYISTTLTNTGTVAAEAGTLVLSGSVDNDGLLESVSNSAIDITGPITGSGELSIGYGGGVEVGGATSNSALFNGPGTLRLDTPSSYSGTIYNLIAGDQISLGGPVAISTSVSGSLLEVGLSGGGSLTLAIAGLHTVNDLALVNNVLTATATLGKAMPDLAVTSIAGPASALGGYPVVVNWTITNQGAVAAAGPWTDEVFVASDAAGDNPQLVGTLTYSGTLAAGQSISRTLDVTLPAATSGNEYFVVKTDALDQVTNDGAGPERQAVSASATDVISTAVPTPTLSVSKITPDDGSNLGNVTLTIDGAQFNADEQVSVIAVDGAVRTASEVRWVSGSTLWATVDLVGLATGSYAVEVSDTTRSVTLPGALTVDNNAAGQVAVNLVLPQTITDGQSGTATVTYTNTGDTDVTAPLLEVSSTQALLQGSGDTTGSSSVLFLASGSGGPSGILAPGASGTYTFTVTPTNPTPEGGVEVSLGVAGSSATVTDGTTSATAPVSSTVDWSSVEASLRPPTVDSTDWNNVFTQFVARVGTTTQSLDTALSADASELAQVGQPTSDVTTLLQYELFQASGALAGATIDATDISASSSSLSLSLDRYYDGTLLDRDATGAFGDGWNSTYDVTAVTDSFGNVYIQTPTALHVFTLQADGSYAAGTDDPSTLTLSGGLFSMNDGSGGIDRFNAAGKLASITDSNGNTVDLTYGTNGMLQTVKNLATGETITFTSNAAGRIISAADGNGQTVTYTYDPTNTLLLSSAVSGGTTTYTYAPATGSVQANALTSITNPDGTQQTFTYDAEGRLASQSGSGGTGTQTYSYNSAGTVTVTDALGDKTTLLYGANGAVAQTQDALGNVTQLRSNTAGELTSATTAGGSLYQYAYDTAGNLTSYTDPLGGTASASYASGTDNLTSFTDQRGDTTHYTYNTAGNVTGITYEDGSGDTYQYDAQGLLTSSTDADGSTTRYGYDSAGDLTSETFSNGTADTYTYSQGNLTSATAPGEGTTRYTYNSADQLTSVTNPQGQVESYTYNALGQLATRTEPGGVVTQYSYNSAGQLAELQDGSGSLDKYTYDAAGELLHTDTGSGASTAYQYDPNGNVTEILNSNADGSVGSRYDYTYNTSGQVVEEATSDGLWNYGYDASGQLTQANFRSINPSIQNQNISYAYDAAGNRVSQSVNGVVTFYTTNALNEYSAVGGTTYTYDADGNVVSETNSNGTTRFTYNQNGQLTSEIGLGGTNTYTYDALGDLVASVQDGVAENYIEDLLTASTGSQSLPVIAQSYNSSEKLIASYNYGLGLAAETSVAGTSYYLIDADDNVVGLVSSQGLQSTSYGYSPFGETIDLDGSQNTSFGFGGGTGELSIARDFVLMRARAYDAAIGRFVGQDSSGLAGGINEYAYSLNSPANQVDPTGLQSSSGGAYHTDIPDPPGFEDTGLGGAIYADGTIGGILRLGGALVPSITPYTNFSTSPNPVTAGSVVAQVDGVNKNIATGFGLKDANEDLNNGNFKSSMDTVNDPAVISATKNAIVFVLLHAGLTHTVFGRLILAAIHRDPHIATFDGLYYDFQTAGEFTLTRQTTGGDFTVQARISAPVGVSMYSVITELGIQVGADRVTIDSTRAAAVWVDGTPVSFASGAVKLADGEITQTQAGYLVTLDTGESVSATIDGVGTQQGAGTTSAGIDALVSLNPFVERQGTVEGLLGNDNGDPSKDLTLADGTVLPTNMPTAELYGAYADSWRVTQATSLLDYGPGQTTATFTDTSYPGTPISIASFPNSAVQMATAVVEQMGITDPGLQQDAIYDYLVTGNRSLLITEANLQQEGVTTTLSANPTLPAPPPEVGIIAAQASETEAASGATTAQFQVYRSGDTSGAATVSYAVVAPDGTYVGAGSFGGTLPSGTITFAAGQDSVDLPITLTQAIGNAPSKKLEVQLSATSPIDVIGQTAQVQIVNPAPAAGPPAAFGVELVSDPGLTPTQFGDTSTFQLGASGSTPVTLAIENTAAIGADMLSGTITAAGDGFKTTVVSSFSDLLPSAILDVATLSSSSSSGGSETLTIALQDTNASGYSAALPTETVTLTDEANPPCFARGTRVLTVRGEVAVEALREGDLVVTLLDLDAVLKPVRWLGHRRLNLRRQPSPDQVQPVRLRAGALREGVPHRDLVVSPGHRFLLDGLLVAACELINGATVVQERWDEVEYWHVELDRHDVILAEGMAAESYHDVGNRDGFENGTVVSLHPELDQHRHAAEPCRPYGLADQTLRERLFARAEALGWTRLTEPSPWLEVDGEVIQPEQHGDDYRFTLPAEFKEVLLRSRTSRPRDVDVQSEDDRTLGLSVAQLTLQRLDNQVEVVIDDGRLSQGFWAAERVDGQAWRWTNGCATLPVAALMAGAQSVKLQINRGIHYWSVACPPVDCMPEKPALPQKCCGDMRE